MIDMASANWRLSSSNETVCSGRLRAGDQLARQAAATQTNVGTTQVADVIEHEGMLGC